MSLSTERVERLMAEAQSNARRIERAARRAGHVIWTTFDPTGDGGGAFRVYCGGCGGLGLAWVLGSRNAGTLSRPCPTAARQAAPAAAGEGEGGTGG